MAKLFVNVPGDTQESFENVNLQDASSILRAAVAERIGAVETDLQLYFCKYIPPDVALVTVGVVGGSVLRAACVKRDMRHKQAQRRLDLGLSRAAPSLKRCFTQVGEKVKADGDETRGVVAGLANQVTAMQGNIDTIQAAVTVQPPLRAPGETELMVAIDGKFNVARLNQLLVEYRIGHPRGLKKLAKALLLAQQVPLLELQALLRDEGRGGDLQPTGLSPELEGEFQRRLALQVARGPLDAFNEGSPVGVVGPVEAAVAVEDEAAVEDDTAVAAKRPRKAAA